MGPLAQQGLIVGGGSRRGRLAVEEPVQVGLMVVGQRVQRRLGPAPRREDALHGLEAERAVPHGPLQRRQDVGSRVGRRQRQDAFGLVLAGPVAGEQALQELCARRAELREPPRELFRPSPGVSGRLVVRAVAPLTRDGPRQEPMPRRFHERLVVDHQFVLGHPHRDDLADQPPGRRVEVLAVDHEPLGVDGAVHDLGGVERPRRQRDQVGPFLGVSVDRPRLGLAVDADVGDLGQPPRRGLVQVPEAAKGPAAEQAGFDIGKWPLDFPFRLRPPRAAGHGAEAVMRRERRGTAGCRSDRRHRSR